VIGIKKIKNVLYIGDFHNWYPRNYIFIQGLRAYNINVYEINFRTYNKIKKIKIFLKHLIKLRNERFDLVLFYSIFVSPLDFLLARILAYSKRIPLVNDIFISKLLTYYYDNEFYKKRKVKIKFLHWIYYYIIDFLECHLANYVILDTTSHIKFFYEKFKVPLKKFRKIYVGSRNDIFYPIEKKKKDTNKTVVGFWGHYIPLHGVQYIIKAIKLLENDDQLNFFLLGRGNTYKENRNLADKLNLRNTEFIDVVPIKKLPEFISKCDIGLGIFGNTPKADKVIPNKIFEGNAMKVPMISCESHAINELYNNYRDILLCKPANPESLVESILKLKNDTELREKIRENAYKKYHKYASSKAIGERLIKILNQIIFKN